MNVVNSLFQSFRWWGASEKSGRGRKIDEGKNRAAPVSPRFFPLVFLFALATYDLTCSPLSKRLEQATLSRKIRRLYRGSYRVLNSWKSFEICLSNFPDLEKVWKMKIKSGKMVKCLEILFVCFESYSKCFRSEMFFVLVECYSCWSNVIQSRLNPNPNPNPKAAFSKKR